MLQSTAQVIPKFFVESIAIFALLAIIFFMVIGGVDVKSQIPIIGIYAIAAFRIIPTINRMMQSYQMLQYGLTSVEDLIRGMPESSCEQSVSVNLNHHGKDLCFSNLSVRGLSYAHEGSNNEVLNDISFDLHAGDKIAIVGQSGSGKSTLIDILLGLNVPAKGFVSLNGQRIYECLGAWREIIGYVPQDLHLTSTTIRDNITFSDSNSNVDEELLTTIIDISGIKNFMGESFDRQLGRQGLKISGGQKQRIAIARALYKRPQVLIFDEATSALDQKSEEEIMSNIQKYFVGISLISVTHKIYDNGLYDKIYQLKRGLFS